MDRIDLSPQRRCERALETGGEEGGGGDRDEIRRDQWSWLVSLGDLRQRGQSLRGTRKTDWGGM